MATATKAKFTLITETEIKKCSTNGGRLKEVLFMNGKKEQFKITILSESYDSQSYARLYKWTSEKGFSLIIGKRPLEEYGIKIAYQENFSQSAFNLIIKDLQKIAESF